MTVDINRVLALPAWKACGPRGADMGRSSQCQGEPERLYLQRVRFIDCCYDPGGAYWGMPANLWCAFSPDTTANDPPVMVFVRGDRRAEAKQNVLECLPGEGWSFYR